MLKHQNHYLLRNTWNEHPLSSIPMTDPWCWNIYLHWDYLENYINGVNVFHIISILNILNSIIIYLHWDYCKYSSTMDPLGFTSLMMFTDEISSVLSGHTLLQELLLHMSTDGSGKATLANLVSFLLSETVKSNGGKVAK